VTVLPHRADPSAFTCVFAVCHECDPAALRGLTGHNPSAPVRPLLLDSLTAVVQDVPAEAFCEPVLQKRLSNRYELERCARAHHSVVSAVAFSGPTVPLPLATLYLGDERARATLSERTPEFRKVLERIAGRSEWGAKVHVTGGAVTGPAAREASSASVIAGVAVGAGHAYLEKVRSRQRARAHRYDAALRIAEEVDTAARGIAVAGRRLRQHGPELTGERHTQVLNAAYLVPRDRGEELTTAVAPLGREPGIRIDITGPWVPYSFTEGDGHR
jgi:hypothetical protein